MIAPPGRVPSPRGVASPGLAASARRADSPGCAALQERAASHGWTAPPAWAAVRHSTGLALLCFLAACASGPATQAPAVSGRAAPAPRAAPLDASYDWHGLVFMPFGSLLKDSPRPLHEVLLFHDDAHAGATPGKDCYTVDGKPPRLVGHDTQDFLLCFSHDRLDRIEASVALKAGEGPAVLARACASWLKSPAPPSGGICEGQEGEVTFSAHLGGEPAAVFAAPGGSPADILSVTLTSTAERGGAPE